jgi:hypothetical protein
MARHYRKWGPAMIMYLEFLVNLGLRAKEIARDPIIDSTPNNVHRQVGRFGYSLRRARAGGREDG